MPIETRPMDGPFGIEVLGLDLAQPMTQDQVRELISIFHNNQVMVVLHFNQPPRSWTSN